MTEAGLLGHAAGLRMLEAFDQVFRNGSIRTDLHQFMEKGFGVLFCFNAMALLWGRGPFRFPAVGIRALGVRQWLGQLAAKVAKSFKAAWVEAHGSEEGAFSCSRDFRGSCGLLLGWFPQLLHKGF